LHTVIVAGEACTRALVARHHAGLPDVALYNEYGPTEGTVWSSVYHCQGQDVSTAVPIGRPIANMQIYLLNPQLQPVPVGVPGEIYIGGAGVAVGYVNQVAFTAERFLPHPFSSVPGVRLYKTGDLGRYRPDGTIEFLGRIDHQVKIRGFRIELGEIEAVLHAHPGVADAVVVARERSSRQLPRRGPAGSGALGPDEASHEQRLIAYLVPRQDPPPSPGELRRFLQAKLPDYMVPALFVRLEALPLAPNGKIDPQALPEAEELHRGLDATYVMPGTEAEHTIARVWQEVLHVDRVGIHDNFFDLGGHSLAMVQVHSTLQDIYSRALSLIDMFQYPTISALAKYVSQEESEPSAVQHSEARAETRREAMRRHRHSRQERRHE
jgi:acyl-CoA synthetase (AMP-forming)/AMP-acid ligase II/acyl carrier protein